MSTFTINLGSNHGMHYITFECEDKKDLGALAFKAFTQLMKQFDIDYTLPNTFGHEIIGEK
jgi:hypothetical protein